MLLYHSGVFRTLSVIGESIVADCSS